MEGFYLTLPNTTYDNNPTKGQTGECWHTIKLMVKVFLIELRKTRVGAEAEYGLSDPQTKEGQYLWHTIQSHIFMMEFQEACLYRHTSMDPSVANMFFDDRD